MSQPLSLPKARKTDRIVVAHRSRMDLHDEPVLEAHARHFGQHLRAEHLGVGRRGAAAADAAVERGRFALWQVGGARGRVAVVGRGAADRLEIGAAPGERGEIAVVGRDVAIGDAPELRQVLDEARKGGIDDRVGTEGGEHPAAPAARLHLAVMAKVVERALRRGQGLDVEPLEQRARPEFRPLQAGGDVIVGPVGVPGAEALMEAEDFGEGVVEDRGLITPRREGNARFYRAADRMRFEMILPGKKLGFTLTEIIELIGGRGATESPDLEEQLQPKQIANQISHLGIQRNEIEGAIQRLRATQDRLLQGAAA